MENIEKNMCNSISISISTKISSDSNSSNNSQDLSNIEMKNSRLILLLTLITRFNAGYFRISLSLSGQALLWKVLIGDKTNNEIHNSHKLRRIFRAVPETAFSFLWSLALFVLASQSLLYLLRCVFRRSSVRAEFLHRIGANYLFAPWISWLFLLQSSPFISPECLLYRILWWLFVIPIVVLDVKIYGQWFTTKGNKRFLSAVASPASQLSVIGNLAAARAAAQMGWYETALCMFSLGATHYLVVFVTLYQRHSENKAIPTNLRPTYFLFVGAPAMASLAWSSIALNFDITAKIFFFLSLFLFMSLVSRPSLFRKAMSKFNVAWWGFSFPVTILALASTEYAEEVNLGTSHVLMIALCGLSFFICLVLICVTAFHSNMLSETSNASISNHNHNNTTTTRPRRCDFA